ncbi:hypothetical protein ACFQ07_20800 [Actinomadura adrarensis]|uniref:Uncharacterized protein n=1 Tax=Actinomadura adrarensis TaxID=1819600 RepID=A0ABW3CJG2_9ACTN
MRTLSRRVTMARMEWSGFPPLWGDIAVAVLLLYPDAAAIPALVAFGLNVSWVNDKISGPDFLWFSVQVGTAFALVAVVTGGGMMALGFWITGIVQTTIFGGATVFVVVGTMVGLCRWAGDGWADHKARRRRRRAEG